MATSSFLGESSNGFSGFLKMENNGSRPEFNYLYQVENFDRSKNEMKVGQKKKIKKERFAFQTRSQVDILDDGYRWRKYGSKAVKNNKFPRSYYRCTNEGCKVKKQIQRLTEDENVVVTTYEGTHNHPIQKQTDNFEHILSRMHIYAPT